MHLSSINEGKRPCAVNERTLANDEMLFLCSCAASERARERERERTHARRQQRGFGVRSALERDRKSCITKRHNSINFVLMNMSIYRHKSPLLAELLHNTKITRKNKTKQNKITQRSSLLDDSFLPSSLCNLTSKNRLKFSREFIYCATQSGVLQQHSFPGSQPQKENSIMP